MSKDLKRLFGLREMAINVPDRHLGDLKRAIATAVRSKVLPDEANSWISGKGTGTQSTEPEAPARSTKKATAVGKKDTPAQGGDTFFSDYKKDLDRRQGPQTKAPVIPPDMDLGPAGPSDDEDDVYDPKMATRGGEPDDDEPDPVAPAAWGGKHDLPRRRSDDGGNFGAPDSANFQVGGEDDDDYRSPFGAIGNGGSSWDDVPAWMRDPERMPHASGGSQRVPGSADRDEPAPKKSRKGPPSAVGKPWSAKDVKRMGHGADEPKKPGVLSRLFGRKK